MTDEDKQLFDRFLDGEFSEEESQKLISRLESDQAATEYVVETSILIADLRQSLKRRKLLHHVSSEIPSVVPFISDLNSQKTVFRRKRIWFLAAAVAALVAGSLTWMFISDKHGSAVEILELQKPTPPELWTIGKNLRMQDLVLDSGTVDLRMEKDVVVKLEGPLRGEIISNSHLRLTRGTATATVGAGGKGFVIETPQARIVDQGTSFGVSVGSNSETDVIVYEGMVDVFGSRDKDLKLNSQKLSLSEGEAVRVGALNNIQRLRMIKLGAANYFPARLKDSVVSDVKDNIPPSDSNRFYGLIPGGMNEGTRLYTTGHTRKWHAYKDAEFPRELIGADVICTFSDSRQVSDLQITLTVDEPCEIFVLPDARSAPPEWVQKEFEDTQLKIRSGPWLARNTPLESLSKSEIENSYVPHSIWSRKITEPGTVVLGPATIGGGIRAKTMYGIAVKRLNK